MRSNQAAYVPQGKAWTIGQAAMNLKNNLDTFLTHKWFIILAQCFLIIGPFASMSGNAVSDIWLSIVAASFLGYSTLYGKWQWAKEPWFLIAFLLWVWLIFTSVISAWPEKSLSHALPWIRFPVFAAAFAFYTRYSPQTRKYVFAAFLAGLVIMMGVLAVERYNHPDAVRLYGTWHQHTKAGWYMLGYGMLVAFWALGKMHGKHIFWTAPLIILIIAFTITTGEIYVSLSLLFGICFVFFLDNFSNWKRLLLLGSMVATPFLLVLAFSPSMRDRFVFGIQQRLPWLPSSDYYPAWMGGYRVGLMNPITGVGADNYDRACLIPEVFAKLDVIDCMSHPHQIYIQTFAETGIIGFVLFILLVLAILFKTLPLSEGGLTGKCHFWMRRDDTIFSSQAIGLIIVVFWPISTYSEAFGQHKNFFTWLAIGWAFSLIQRYKKKESSP